MVLSESGVEMDNKGRHGLHHSNTPLRSLLYYVDDIIDSCVNTESLCRLPSLL